MTFTNRGQNTVTPDGFAATQPFVNIKDYPYFATCDGVTDEASKLQLALTGGGTIVIPSGANLYCTGVNLTGVSHTHLIIQRNGKLTLNNARLSFVGAGISDVKISGGGTIRSTSLNNTDTAPTNWVRRGIVEFGGTTASIGDGFTIEDVEVYGDFTGTPGTGGAVTATSKRVGICTSNAKNVRMAYNRVHGIYNECILHNGNAVNGDANIEYIGNKCYDSNHDAFGPMTQTIDSMVYRDNIMTNCFAGIESVCGLHIGNKASAMQNYGYWLGGNAILDGHQAVFIGNVGEGNCVAAGATTYDFNMSGVALSTQGSLVLQNNSSFASGGGAFTVQNMADAVITGNVAQKWAAAVAGNAFGVTAVTDVTFDGNAALNEGANSTGGFNVTGTKVMVGSGNRTYGVAIPWINAGTASQGWQPSLSPVITVNTVSYTGDTNAHNPLSYTVKAKTLGKTGAMEIIAYGSSAGAGGNKTVKLIFGGSTATTITIGTGTLTWKLYAIVQNQFAANAQFYSAETNNGAGSAIGSSTLGIDTGSDQTLLVQGQLVNGGDSLTFGTIVVRFITGYVP